MGELPGKYEVLPGVVHFTPKRKRDGCIIPPPFYGAAKGPPINEKAEAITFLKNGKIHGK